MPSVRRLLTPHPDTPGRFVRGIKAYAYWAKSDGLAFNFLLEGDIGRLRIPGEMPVRQASELWKHTCFEAFIKAREDHAYFEFNFSPSRAWTIYRFSAYREGQAPADAAVPLVMTVRRNDRRLELNASVHLDRLPKPPLKLALSAVIEDEGGTLSYWALKHPPGKPDFHHANSFVLDLEPARLDELEQACERQENPDL